MKPVNAFVTFSQQATLPPCEARKVAIEVLRQVYELPHGAQLADGWLLYEERREHAPGKEFVREATETDRIGMAAINRIESYGV